MPEDYDKEEFARIKNAAAKIRSDSEALVVIGIGGSYLGARAAIEFVRSKNYNLLGFTFWYYYTDDEEFLKTMKNTGTPLYVHTVNEKEELKKYIDLGISGIYTDVTKKDDLYYD